MLLDVELLDQLYAAVNESVLILNQQRQIVFCNEQFAALLRYARRSDLLGMRPGEALGCVNASGKDGCGAGASCYGCGALMAVLNAQQGTAEVRECQLLRGPRSDAMDLLVRATPMKFKGEDFTIFAIIDISHEKRRNALERVFFHDLMNTAAGIQMLSSRLGRAKPGDMGEISSDISQGVQQLVEEIGSQRDLLRAENNELPVRPVELNSKAILLQVLERYESFAKMQSCELLISPETEEVFFRSDPTILTRVIGNTIKNALEACSEGQAVTIASHPYNGSVSFSVHNPGHIPQDVQIHLFKRSFSTKGPGRGLGTYSMKLLTERYLKGKVAFTTSTADGTTFTINLP